MLHVKVAQHVIHLLDLLTIKTNLKERKQTFSLGSLYHSILRMMSVNHKPLWSPDFQIWEY